MKNKLKFKLCETFYRIEKPQFLLNNNKKWVILTYEWLNNQAKKNMNEKNRWIFFKSKFIHFIEIENLNLCRRTIKNGWWIQVINDQKNNNPLC